MQSSESEPSSSNGNQIYQIDRWGGGYFGVNDKGHLTVKPLQTSGRELDVYHVAQEARKQGLYLPLLLRFHDLLRHRVESINQAFIKAIQDNNYKGSYRGVFPIKVNQLREVVEEISSAGRPYHYGIEVGSKPELFAGLAIHEDPESLLICNGYKDAEFIRTALIGRKLGKKIIMVVEKLEELQRIVEVSKEMNVEPLIGVRIRLQTKGSGKWALSSGEKAKFGLSTIDLIEAGQILQKNNLEHCLELVHFHVGSQVTDILTIKRAVREAARYYAKLHKLGFKPQYLDVGGGLGVDYDGTQTNTESSMNYNLIEYTQDVVYNIGEVCNEENVPHPTIVNESGRAVVAQHSVLIVEVFGSIERTQETDSIPAADDHKLVVDLTEILKGLNKRNRRESLHDALQIREESLARFNLGLIDLPTKAKIDGQFWQLAKEIVAHYQGAKNIPAEVQELSDQLSDQFLCNFSVFQSLIDHWALGQMFPIIPLHRLNEEPSRDGMLVDITCDSDGKINRFIDGNEVRSTLPLHKYNGEPYLIAIMMVGAYQDVMGDLHNLFGPVNEAHIYLDEDEQEGFYIEETIPGYSIGQVLNDVQYDSSQLARLMKAQIDQAIKDDRLKPNEGMKMLDRYEKGLQKPTYLSFSDSQPIG